MTTSDAVEVVYGGLAGPNSIPLKLRQREGLDRAQLAEVETALELLAEEYSTSSVLPKRLAAALVDIQAAMEQSRAWYPEAEQDQIQDAADRLSALAYQVVGE